MNRDDIIRMAREAGATFDHMTWVERDLAPVFERFAAVVAAVEREACAKVCDCEVERLDAREPRASLVAGICAAAIRARSKA